MRGTPSCMTTSASLPIMRRIWPQARAEPMPSPSGRACEVTTKRRRARISCRTRSNMRCSSFSCRDGGLPRLTLHRETRHAASLWEISRPLGAWLSILPLTFLGAAEKFVDPALQFIGTIDLEIKLRRPPKTQPFREFVPDIILRSRETFQGPLGLGLIAGNADHDAGRTRVLSHDHGADAGQTNARIAEFAFEDGFDLLADRLAQPSAMIFLATMLHATPRMEENS